jgi:hypothetical protein
MLLVNLLRADPGVGIVLDSKGNIYYTDLLQVWMQKPDGTKSIAVPNVHTHELYLDKNDNLFGEHLWYNGEEKNTWGHYFWCRYADGHITKVKDSTEGFPQWYSFTRDDAGNMYYQEQSIPSKFWKIDSAGNKTLLGSKSFSAIGRLHFTKKGKLYFSNEDDLYCITPGDSIKLILKGIGEKGILSLINSDRHAIMNIWSDAKENIYIATGNVIKMIDSKNVITTIYKSATGWNPVSGFIASNGDFWVMENNAGNGVRVNKISMEERKQIVKEFAVWLYVIPLILIIGLLYFLYIIFKPNNKSITGSK